MFRITFLLVLLTFQAAAQTVIFPFGSSWKFLDNGSDQATAWRATSFNDGTWKTGNGKFGYGISDAATSISFGPNAKKKYITTYFRKSISIADISAYSSFTAGVKRDDGVVVYVNGTEVYRNNMPTGTITYTTTATEAKDNGSIAQVFTIPASTFSSGTNLIAVEIHQQRVNTPDMAFDLELVGNRVAPPVNQPPTVSISAPVQGASFILGQPISIAASASDPEGDLAVVEFFANGISLGQDITSPYGISWTPANTGSFGLTARATDGSGASAISASVMVTVTDSPPTDNTPPIVTSINRQNPTTEITSATTVIFRTTFSEQVTGVDAGDFTVTPLSGTVKGAVTASAAVGTSGAIYDVTVSSISGEGVLRLDLKSSGTGIADMAGNAISGGYTSGQSYTIQQSSQSPPGTVLPFKSSWRYLDNGSDQGTAWRSTSFDDNAWKTGNGKFGYGITDAATTISYGSNSSKKYITTYFRKSINITDIAAYTSFSANILRDDGFVMYVNGIEVYRNNMPLGTIAYNIIASSSHDDGYVPHPFLISASAFKTGTNVIAVEMHQSSTTSSDLAFDLEILGNTSPTLVRGPYLQIGSQTGMTLRWKTDVATNSKVEFGTSLGSYPHAVTDPTPVTEHEVRITGLTPGTKYYYRIGSTTQVLQGSSENYFKTAPSPTTTEKIRIAVFGDSGTNEEAQRNRQGSVNSYLNYTSNNPADLMLLLGDNAEPNSTETDYQNVFFRFFDQHILKNHVVFPAPGNNEYKEFGRTSKENAYYKVFSMPTAAEGGGVASNNKSYYSFDWGDIHFISLDSYGTESDGTALYNTSGMQATWLKKDLVANTKKWTIVFFHHSPYTMGGYNSDTETTLTRIRQNILPILESYGVDLVLSGHSHTYERSYLLNNYYSYERDFSIPLHTKSNSSAKYDNSNNSCPYVTTSRTPNRGTVYAVSSSYYAYYSSVQPSFPHDALPFASFGSTNGGMLYLEVQDNRLDAKFIRRDGAISDQFTIMHDVNKINNISIAPGSPVQLTASWIGNYKWSTGATTRSITVSPTVATTYQVTDNSNCLTDVFHVSTSLAFTGAQGGENDNQQKAEDQTDRFEVYPTLAKRGTAIQISTNYTETSEALVTDMTGRLLATLKFTGTTSIETTDLPSGMYFISLSGNKQIKKHKFIISD